MRPLKSQREWTNSTLPEKQQGLAWKKSLVEGDKGPRGTPGGNGGQFPSPALPGSAHPIPPPGGGAGEGP